MLMIFENILRMSLQTSIVIFAVLLARLMLRGAPRKYSYALWSVVLFRMVCPVSFKSSFSLGSLVNGIASRFQSNGEVLSALGNSGASAADNVMGGVTSTLPETALPESIVNTPTVPSVNASANAVEALSFADVLAYALAIIWALGVVSMLILGFVSYIKVRSCTKGAVMTEDGVYESERVQSPFVIGYINPRIIVPEGLDDGTLGYVISHERAHIKRLDHIMKGIFYIALSVHWFNPLCWLAFVLMSRDMEISCDEKVLSNNDIGKEYSMALLKIASLKKQAVPAPVGFGEVGVKTRISYALSYKKPRSWVTVLSLLLCVLTLFGCAADTNIGGNTDSGEGSGLNENGLKPSEISELDDAVTRVLLEYLYDDTVREPWVGCESHGIIKAVEDPEENTVLVFVVGNYMMNYNTETGELEGYYDLPTIHFIEFLKTDDGYEAKYFVGDGHNTLGDDSKREEFIDKIFPDGGKSEYIALETKIWELDLDCEITPYRYAADGKLYEVDENKRAKYFESLISTILDSGEDHDDPEENITENREAFDTLVGARDVDNFLIEEFLKGGNDDLRGFVMYRALSEYLINNSADEYISEEFDFVPLDENGDLNGQLYFDELLNHALELSAEYGTAQLNGKYPTWSKIVSGYKKTLSNEEYLNIEVPYPVPDAITVRHNGESVTFRKGEEMYYEIYRFNTSLSVAYDKALSDGMYSLKYLCDTPDYESLIDKYTVFEIETYPYIEYVYDDGVPGCIFAARGAAVLVPLMNEGEEPLYAAYQGWIHHGNMGELLESCFE